MNIDERLDVIGRHPFRARFRLRGRERAIVERVDQFPTLHVIPRGAAPVTDRLDEDFVERILIRFRATADIIIISGAPVHQSPAALFWGRAAEGTLIVVEAGETSLDRVQEAFRNLSFASAAVVGTVLGRRRRLRALSRRRRTPKATPAPEPSLELEPESPADPDPDLEPLPDPEPETEPDSAAEAAVEPPAEKEKAAKP